MNQHHLMILNALKKAFHYQEDGYAQWLAAVSLKENSATSHRYQLRLLILTSNSPYLDGTDLVVTIGTHQALLDTDIFQGTPILQGSPMMDALNWIRSYGPLIHWQAESPF